MDDGQQPFAARRFIAVMPRGQAIPRPARPQVGAGIAVAAAGREQMSRRDKKKAGPVTGEPGSNGAQHLIDLRGVVKTYQTAAGGFTALKGVNLEVDPGEFVAVIGKSGSGKSTLINMITGIDRPSSGEVWVSGTGVHTLNEGQLAAWRGRNVGLIFQFFQLLPTLTIAENVMLPMDFCNMYDRGERPGRAMRLLEEMELVDEANKLPAELSGGQQQRVAIARALANDPPILVADEPTGNLDSRTAASVFEMFERLVSGGKTILMVTHDRDLAQKVTRTVVISDGEIIEQYLAQTFPTLNEQLLAKFTRQIERRRVAPGAILIEEGSPPDAFYIVTKGQVEIHLHARDGQDFVVARHGPGYYVGEVELLRGGKAIATVRASAGQGAEVAVLSPDEFCELMEDSEATRAIVERVAQERLAENEASRSQ
jgi:ABC-type lipoprotein export system ATPase subunit